MLLQKQFWMFCVFLMIITLLSSFGGGIRYRENFLEEVYDLNDITNDLRSTDDFYPVNINSQVYEESAGEKIEEEIVSIVQPKPVIPVIQQPPVPIQLQVPVGAGQEFAPFDVIEAYTGESFASYKN
jgi:hypothetical protein